ncbi:two-component system sensor histidine kinase YesM [Paenibacillus endophyticus]|uniref:Two-component system sensor histidine kinase YesM n=1 Tax=Paenibacillus endophyticus TaxID=1294268 RepID=A0A7W5C3H3_9BACL|nr:histidine kinase [Paenibacillus endophyticus]MBB3150470.1 two-component system sensor histidine kinase YesM [Paenibacillus endophyticus]
MFNGHGISLRNSIFLRLLLTFLLIMLPMWSLGVYIYNWIVQTAREDISKTAVSQIDYYLSDMEKEIERMKLLQYSLLDDEDLNELALTWETMDTIARMEHINSLLKRIYTIQNSSIYIQDVSVHIAPIGKTLSGDGAREFDEERYLGIRSVFGSDSQIIEWKGDLFLSAFKPGGSKEAVPLFTVEIALDSKVLQDELSQFNLYADSGAMLVHGTNGAVITNGVDAFPEQDMAAFLKKSNEVTNRDTDTVDLSNMRYYYVHAASEKLELSLFRFIPGRVFQEPLDRFYTWAWLFLTLSLAIIAIYALSTYKFIHKPLLTFVKSFRRMESGDLDIFIDHASKDEFRYLYGRFNQMVANLRALIDQAYKQKILAQRAELKQLQSQINPHFLYNSFFILNTMAKTGDTERIEQFTTLLGEYFQFVTRNASDNVQLKHEIRHARMYTEIQEMRFSRRIRVDFQPLPPEWNTMLVPRLIVQPIIENAFEHSLEKKARDGLIAVRFERDAEEVRIIVEDNGDRLTDEDLARMARSLWQTDEQGEITGMVNIHRRIRMTLEGGGLTIARSDLGGLQATLSLRVEKGGSGD